MKTGEKITVKANQEEGKEIVNVIRYDNPKAVHDPTPTRIKGSIFAPNEFISKREKEYKPEGVHVLYNKTKGTIELFCNAKDKFHDHITGELQMNPNLAEFNINGTKEMELSALIKLIRFSRWLFESDADHKRIVDCLMKFSAEVSQSVVKNNDQRGNIEENFVQKIKTSSDLIFTATAATHIGLEPVKFKVDIVCEVRSAKVGFWFESIELKQLIEGQRDQLVMDEVNRLKKKYVCIEQ